jgi:coronin-1B/1C/6
MGFLPKRAVNVAECEIARAYKVGSSDITPISFTVPRKSDAFQSDLFPPTVGDEPVLTADEWFGGKSAKPKIIDLEAGFTVKKKKDFVAVAPAAEDNTEKKVPKNEKEYQEAYHELRRMNEDLKGVVSQRETRIRVLEVELEKLKGQVDQLKITSSESPLSAAKEVIGTSNSETLEDGPATVTSENSTAEIVENL